MDTREEIIAMAKRAREASRKMAGASPFAKNDFLERLARLLEAKKADIAKLNEEDIASAKAAGLDEWRLDRLRFPEESALGLARACREVAAMPDPVGATETQWQRPNGLLVGKMRVPIGVIAMIYEARPAVTIEAPILALKAGNAIILRGGKESAQSNAYLCSLAREALGEAGLPEGAIQHVQSGGREAVDILCGLNEYIDLIIPRGGEGLIRAVAEKATMPALMHYRGVCHIYIDESARLDQALDIVENSKTQRPGVCNALEGLLVHRAVAARFLPMLAQRLAPFKAEFRADPEALPLLGESAVAQKPEDRGQEFLAPILTVCVVEDMDAAIRYIGEHGSRHTEVICTEDYNRAMRFLREVDASMVGVNASTRFNDGGQLGLGAEIGISTTKIHAYGPMGVQELTTTKFAVLGNGQIRA